jgi:hypothetical protein
MARNAPKTAMSVMTELLTRLVSEEMKFSIIAMSLNSRDTNRLSKVIKLF